MWLQQTVKQQLICSLDSGIYVLRVLLFINTGNLNHVHMLVGYGTFTRMLTEYAEAWKTGVEIVILCFVLFN